MFEHLEGEAKEEIKFRLGAERRDPSPRFLPSCRSYMAVLSRMFPCSRLSFLGANSMGRL